MDATSNNSSVELLNRSIDIMTKVKLFVAAGGRCEFQGCADNLLRHHVTGRRINLAEIAHIVGFKKNAARGNYERPADIHDLTNLMLLCPKCHKVVDTHPADYPVEKLREFKNNHEKIIQNAVTQLEQLKQETTVICFTAQIHSKDSRITDQQIIEAIPPYTYRDTKAGFIDLNDLDLNEREDYRSASRTINSRIKQLLNQTLPKPSHLSIFGLAPIPLLISLGASVSDTIPYKIQRHDRQKDSWGWDHVSEHPSFSHRLVSEGNSKDLVALIVSISGQVNIHELPNSVQKDFWIYELCFSSGIPSNTRLKAYEDLIIFGKAYDKLRRIILRDHPSSKTLYLFPAVPPSIAILLGISLMPKVDPTLKIYDYNKNLGWVDCLDVNL